MKRILNVVTAPLFVVLAVMVMLSGCVTANKGGSYRRSGDTVTYQSGETVLVPVAQDQGQVSVTGPTASAALPAPSMTGEREEHGSYELDIDTNPLSWLKKFFGVFGYRTHVETTVTYPSGTLHRRVQTGPPVVPMAAMVPAIQSRYQPTEYFDVPVSEVRRVCHNGNWHYQFHSDGRLVEIPIIGRGAPIVDGGRALRFKRTPHAGPAVVVPEHHGGQDGHHELLPPVPYNQPHR
jgi:hypothetical protein